jgi:DNA-directed RNA polymerase beta subunit
MVQVVLIRIHLTRSLPFFPLLNRIGTSTDYGVSYGTQNQDGTYQYESQFMDDKDNKKPDLDGEDEYMEGDEISQDDLWVVISSFFDEMGLVQQQLSSFNEFIETTLNDVMEEHGNLALDQISQNTGATYDQSVSEVLLQRSSILTADLPSSDVSTSLLSKSS